ncbi:hypothetical protein [Clostridium tyrobutyricum]|uniref:hypothetical protein n=1 Tax=Clostridium tyrobutyricum TaxID=1519 RepID=UPI00068DE230|nr:hypothetical protein [Clostridium tyrobutyricum]
MKVDKGFIEKHNIIIELENGKCEGNLEEYLEDYKMGGVWALFGKEFDNNDQWFCLQVAKTENIAGEIKRDISCLKSEIDPEKEKIEKNYVNQFGKHMFSYNEYPSSREYLYSEIAKIYKYLIFICVSKENDAAKRSAIETYFAWMARALYWRNGRAYKKEKNYSKDALDKIQSSKFMNINLDVTVQKNLDSFFEEFSNNKMD